jgi:hypothetical protein
MYALTGDDLTVAKEGTPWTQIAAAYLGGSTGNPTMSTGHVLVSGSDGLLHCRCYAAGGGGWSGFKDADGVGPWSTEAGLFRAGINPGYGNRLWEHPDTANEYYSYGAAGILTSIRGGVLGELCIFPDSAMEQWAGITHDSTYVYLRMPDTTRPNYLASYVNVYRALRTDMKFKRIASIFTTYYASSGMATANGQIYLSGGDMGSNRAFFYSTDQGENWSLSSVPETTAGGSVSGDNGVQPGVIWQGRLVFGTWAAGAATPGIWYSDEFTNATQFDNLVLEQANWNIGRYAASVYAKSHAANVSGYIRLTLNPKDDSSAVTDFTVRYDRNYYTVPPKSTWEWYRIRLDQRTADSNKREDGFRQYLRSYNQDQKVYMDGVTVVADTLIPPTFIHPLEPRTDESMTFPDVIDIDAFKAEFSWVPICGFADIETDLEIARFSYNANNYLRIVCIAGSRWQREYSGAVYGPHDPVIRLEKVRGGAVTATIDHIAYWGYDLRDGSSEHFEDSLTFSVTHYAGQILEFDVRRMMYQGRKTSSDDLTALGSSGLSDITYNGVGYYSNPELIIEDDWFSTFPESGVRAVNYLPIGRLGILNRLRPINEFDPVLTGERDPSGGVVIPTITGAAYVGGDDFQRGDDPNLGDRWNVIKQTGAGWNILTNKADCTSTGYEYWVNKPKHQDIIVAATVTVANNGDGVGVLARIDINRSDVTGYGAEIVQTGVAAATLYIVRFFNGTKETLSSQALSAYTTGTAYLLRLTLSGTTYVARAYESVTGILVATATAVDTNLALPGYVGIYGETAGAGNHVTLDDFEITPNFQFTVV